MGPREAAEKLVRRDPAEEGRVWVGRQGARILGEEGDRTGAVTNEDAVILRGVRERGYRRRKSECIDVDLGVESEMRALGNRIRARRSAVGALRGQREQTSTSNRDGEPQRVVDPAAAKFTRWYQPPRDREAARPRPPVRLRPRQRARRARHVLHPAAPRGVPAVTC